jgi:hypothetical protein
MVLGRAMTGLRKLSGRALRLVPMPKAGTDEVQSPLEIGAGLFEKLAGAKIVEQAHF